MRRSRTDFMGNGTERISGQLNETEAPVADGVWNDTGEEPDVAAQDAEDLRRTGLRSTGPPTRRRQRVFGHM